MTYRELTMMDVKELLRRWQARHGIKAIARESGIDRKTIRRYFAAAEALGIAQDAALTDDIVHGVAQFVQARPTPTPSEAREDLTPHRARIKDWLEAETPLQLTRVHTLLLRDGVTTSYATLRRFAIQEFGWGLPKATVRLIPITICRSRALSTRFLRRTSARRCVSGSTRSSCASTSPPS